MLEQVLLVLLGPPLVGAPVAPGARVAAGASPVEAAIFSNHAAGVVVGKVGTAADTSKAAMCSCFQTT